MNWTVTSTLVCSHVWSGGLGSETVELLFLNLAIISPRAKRTSDGGNGNHSVSLPIVLIKIKVGQMLQYFHIRGSSNKE